MKNERTRKKYLPNCEVKEDELCRKYMTNFTRRQIFIFHWHDRNPNTGDMLFQTQLFHCYFRVRTLLKPGTFSLQTPINVYEPICYCELIFETFHIQYRSSVRNSFIKKYLFAFGNFSGTLNEKFNT